MSQTVKIATVQPPAVTDDATPDSIVERALELLHQAAADGADIICLPEYLNAMACDRNGAGLRAKEAARRVLADVSACAAKHSCYVITPVLIDTDEGRFNRTYVHDRNGRELGQYDKVHLTRTEQNDWNTTPGNDWPIFDCDFGKIGIMTCYDGCFSEPSRILALQGADIIFWPSLQRSYTESELILQSRAHAYFNHVHIVRSSYGTEPGSIWAPGQMVGNSCICGPDGTILSSLGRWVGWTSTIVDLSEPLRGIRSFGAPVGNLREMKFEDRHPETYERIMNK